jgi:hypothetical protein
LFFSLRECIFQQEAKSTAVISSAVAAHLRPENAPDVQVLWEDQKRINRFGRLNLKLTELKEEIKDTKVSFAAIL